MSVTIRESHTAVIDRDRSWYGAFATEPYEAAWASEAIFFVRALGGNLPDGITARVQISPDGMHWCDEGTTLVLPNQVDQVTFCRVSHFGGWLRLAGEIPGGRSITVIVYLTLKA
ncbi:MAG: hypothetical protein IT324_19730 [Anaerolineae bacterium]|nr:hypothetical protein [Anaerolineae bacterium]